MRDGLLLVLFVVGCAFLILMLMAWMRREIIEAIKFYVKRSALNASALPALPGSETRWKDTVSFPGMDGVIHAGDCPDNLLTALNGTRSATQQVLDGDFQGFVDQLSVGDVDLTDPDQAAAAWMLDDDEEE